MIIKNAAAMGNEMRGLFYSLMTIASLLGWLGSASPLLTQNVEKLNLIGMVSATMVVVALLIFRTSKFNALISDSSLESFGARVHKILLLTLMLISFVVIAIMLYQSSLGRLGEWQNTLLLPFALFFFNAASWLLRRPVFAGGRRRSRRA